MFIYDYENGKVVKTFEVTDQPVRCGAFIPRKSWIVVGADDMYIRCYNYNTNERVKIFEAHIDYIRSLTVHPTLPIVVSCSDDMLIKAWDWEKDWDCAVIFEGHSHYVMQVKFNPKDPNTFASASLDHTVKVWNLSSQVPNFTLEGHEKGVNCVDYYNGGDKPYLVTGGDDKTVRIWDYQTKACIQTLEGHSHNVSCVGFLPDRPLIVSGSEDGTVLLWHSNTYRLEQTLNYGFDRCWSVSYLRGSNKVALGFDEGTVLVQMGKDTPVASMDASGKVILAKHNEVSTVNLKMAQGCNDGERLPLPSKELGSCEIYPQTLAHSPNGRFVAVCGDGEYIIYTALNLRNKSFGSADQVVWDNNNGEYATRLGTNDIRVFNKLFKERKSMKLTYAAESIFGGALLGICGQDFVCFYDWDDLQLVRRIDVEAKGIYWSDQAHLLAIVGESSFFVLQYSQDAVNNMLESGNGKLPDDGVEDAFELVHEVSETVQTGRWVGDCFVYTNSSARLNYAVGAEVSTLVHFDRPMYLLGYMPKENKLYCVDKEHNLVAFTLLLAVLEFKTAVVRGAANIAKEKVLKRVPVSEHNKLARFLESQGLREDALELATDPDYRCDLAVSLGRLDLATSIAREFPSELKWRQLADLATMKGDFQLAEECMSSSDDFSGLLTLYSAHANRDALVSLSDRAAGSHRMNVAFLSSFMAGDLEKCLSLLITSGRIPEAAIFARTYMPSKAAPIVDLWRKEVRKAGNVRVADALADPEAHPHLFPGLEENIAAEKAMRELVAKRRNQSATDYPKHKEELAMDYSELLAMEIPNGNGTAAVNGGLAKSMGELKIATETNGVGKEHVEEKEVNHVEEEVPGAFEAAVDGNAEELPADFGDAFGGDVEPKDIDMKVEEVAAVEEQAFPAGNDNAFVDSKEQAFPGTDDAFPGADEGFEDVDQAFSGVVDTKIVDDEMEKTTGNEEAAEQKAELEVKQA